MYDGPLFQTEYIYFFNIMKKHFCFENKCEQLQNFQTRIGASREIWLIGFLCMDDSHSDTKH